MVYLIGIYHEIQHTNDNTEPTDLQEVRKFTDYLENEAITHKVTLIAEESNDEIMRNNEAKTRTVSLGTSLYISIFTVLGLRIERL